jgi:hypothetical protein
MKKILHTSFLTKFVVILALTLVSVSLVYSGNNTQVKVVKCYPNPATSVINFEFPAGVEKNSVIQIYSFSGKKITEVPANGNKITVMLDNSSYYRGVYVFRLQDKSGRIVETGKFQVVR